MYPVLLSLGKFKLYSFGTFIALGAIGAGLLLYKLSKRSRIQTQTHFDLVLYSLLGGLVGARIVYYAMYSQQFQNLWQIIYFWQGGLVALGGLITGFLVYLYHLRRNKLPIWAMLDAGILSLLLGWSIGKLGCHLSACTIGRPAEFLAVNGSYPVDLLSMLWALLLVAVLLFVHLTKKLSHGAIFFIGVEGLLLGEFALKTLKSDFGQGVTQLETISYLLLMILTYIIFWRFHGPELRNSQIGATLGRLISKRRR